MNTSAGLQFFTRGLQLAKTPALRKYVLGPAAISVILISVSFIFLMNLLESYTTAMIDGLPEWLSFLSLVLVPLIYILGLLIGVWFSSFFAVLIASPFLGNLAGATQKLETGCGEIKGLSLGETLLRELRKLGYHLPRFLLALLLTFIPVINLVAPVIWFAFGAWMMAVQFVDYGAENEGLEFATTVKRLKQHRGASMAFGACVALGMSLPLLNFVTIPVAVIGGSLFWIELSAPQANSQTSH